MSFGFSGGFSVEGISFSGEQIVDDVQDGTNLYFQKKRFYSSSIIKCSFIYEFLVRLDTDFLGHLHEHLEDISSGVRSEGSHRSLSVRGDLSEDLVGGLLDE